MNKILIPFLGANDDACLIVEVNCKNGDLIKKGQILFLIETTKSSIDVEAENDGYFYSNLRIGERRDYGDIVGLISDTEIDEERINIELKSFENNENIHEQKITKKAEMIIRNEKIDLNALTIFSKGREINEALVLNFLNGFAIKNKQIGISTSLERVAIIGGVGGGGALIVIDAMFNNPNQIVIGIYDNNESFHGKLVLGVPVLGGEDVMLSDYKHGKFDTIIIAFNKNLKERQEVYNRYKNLNLSFTNVIEQSVKLRTGVQIGEGNIILANCYIAACTVIDNNNFLSSNVFLEHGNIIGSHNAFGPGVFTSGNVIINNRIRFGTGVFVEPNLSIGNNVVLGSFVLVNKDIPENSVLLRKQDYIIKEN
jgi:acetyltransferase-like isoleucine patch superfamily enzyme